MDRDLESRNGTVKLSVILHRLDISPREKKIALFAMCPHWEKFLSYKFCPVLIIM